VPSGKDNRRKSNREADVPVSSFSDIAFLLIIFFILVTSLSQTTGVLTEIPTGQKSEAPPEKTTIVNIHDDKISLNDEEVTVNKLRDQLVGMDLHNKSDNEKVVLLEASGSVTYQTYYDVITAISRAGGAVAVVEEE